MKYDTKSNESRSKVLKSLLQSQKTIELKLKNNEKVQFITQDLFPD